MLSKKTVRFLSCPTSLTKVFASSCLSSRLGACRRRVEFVHDHSRGDCSTRLKTPLRPTMTVRTLCTVTLLSVDLRPHILFHMFFFLSACAGTSGAGTPKRRRSRDRREAETDIENKDKKHKSSSSSLQTKGLVCAWNDGRGEGDHPQCWSPVVKKIQSVSLDVSLLSAQLRWSSANGSGGDVDHSGWSEWCPFAPKQALSFPSLFFSYIEDNDGHSRSVVLENLEQLRSKRRETKYTHSFVMGAQSWQIEADIFLQIRGRFISQSSGHKLLLGQYKKSITKGYTTVTVTFFFFFFWNATIKDKIVSCEKHCHNVSVILIYALGTEAFQTATVVSCHFSSGICLVLR